MNRYGTETLKKQQTLKEALLLHCWEILEIFDA